MPIEKGRYLGSVRNLEDLRCRCVMDKDTGCWHLRTARGREIPADRPSFAVNVYGRGKIPATRVAWEFGRGAAPQKNEVVFRLCGSRDCVNPKHLQCGPRGDLVRQQVKTGAQTSDRKRRLCIIAARSKANVKLTPELAQWARESEQTCSGAAHGLGVPKSRVISIRAGKSWVPIAEDGGAIGAMTSFLMR